MNADDAQAGEVGAAGGSDVTEARAFVLELGRLMHESGATAGRLEGALVGVSESLGLEAEVFSTPTSLIVSFGPSGAQQTGLLRVTPRGAHLEKMCMVDEIASAVALGSMSVAEGRRALGRVVLERNRYRDWLIVAVDAVVCGAVARLFGGGPGEIGAAFLLGGVVALMAQRFNRHEHGSRIVEFGAGLLAASGALAVDRFVTPIGTYTVTVSAIIVLVPGLTLTVAMSELATRNLVSGTARLMGGLMILVSLGFGVALGRQVELWLPAGSGTVVSGSGGLGGEAGKVAALAVAAFCFAVGFRARPKDLLPIFMSCAVGVYGARVGSEMVSAELGAFVGAAGVGLVSNVWSRLRNQPAAVTAMPGLILLVPGSIGFGGLTALFEDDTVSGIDAFVTMVFVAASIVAGLLVANVVYRSRKEV